MKQEKTNESKIKSQIKKSDNKHRRKANYNWIIKIIIIAFVISFIFSFSSELIIPNVNLVIGILLVIIFIFIGVIFDMIGIAVTSSNEEPFHAMSTRKVKGAKIAVNFIKNADKVSSFCNDVIGDICGIISGSAGVIIASNISELINFNLFLTTLIVTSLIAALTIGGKAMGKSVAISKSNMILYKFSKIVAFFYRK